jgi:cellulose synthase/poly-beta-1,6-N-acetylglucosamine synthase-like glycosyltransferase
MGTENLIVDACFWFGVLIIFYVYGGYYGLLWLLCGSRGRERTLRPENAEDSHLPTFSIVITAFNEEKLVGKRIQNLAHMDYDPQKMEVVVASDGSTDSTVEVAKQSGYPNLVVLDFKVNRGRALTQNDAVAVARGDIVVFTDASTEFRTDFLKSIAKYFTDRSVGCVVGNLIYRVRTSAVSCSEGFYWRFEKRIRELESRLGILATATGACMAVRRALWKQLTPIDDCDFTTPLDAILQGSRVVFATDAVAHDEPPHSVKQEFRTRVRQTSKNLAGTIRRWGWQGVLRHPAVSFGLFSHKILRWLTPYFMALVLVCNIMLWNHGLIYKASFIAQVVFYGLALLGAILQARGLSSTGLLSFIFSFCLANIGMAVGVLKGVTGKAPSAYGK